jgi:hypothetical protein
MPTTSNNHPTFEVARELCKLAVREAGQFVSEPDADWTPVLFIESAHGFRAEPLHPDCFATPEDRALLTQEVLPELIRRHQGARAGFAIPAFLSAYTLHSGEPLAGPEDSIEVVALVVLDRYRCECWAATVKRQPRRRPELGPWIALPGIPGGFVEHLRQALCHQG